MAEDFVVAFLGDVLDEAEEQAATSRRRFARSDPWELSEAAFKKRFRLSKPLVENVIQVLEPYITNTSSLQIDLEAKIFCALNFFGHGSYQTPVGDMMNIAMSQPSVSRCIAEVVDAFNNPNIFGQWVRFPDTFQEMNQIAGDFYRLYGIPGTVGCVDCTHVAIVPPSSTQYDERSYVNRKNFHSVNTQLICDTQLKITNVNALFPGGTHDAHIWNCSNVRTLMENIHAAGHKNYHLLGDSGYALRPWCLTPIGDPDEGTPEYRFNQSFKTARCTIERCNGVLKGRFRCLIKDRVLHYTPNKATKIINACTVLHNMCIAGNMPEPIWNDLDQDQLGIFDVPAVIEPPSRRTNLMLLEARAKRQRIVTNYFN